jgi:hypothetical protein
MFIVRLMILLLLTGFTYQLGQLPAGKLNEFGILLSYLFFLFAIILYFFPMYEAYINKQPNFYSIFALNLFLGWTLLGWVAALVWAIKSLDPVRVAAENTPRPSRIIKPKETKQCPFCAEEILIAAIKCKHCGSQVS